MTENVQSQDNVQQFEKDEFAFGYKKKGDKTHLQLGILVGAVKNRITCDIFHLI